MQFVKRNYRLFIFFLIGVNIVFISWRAMQGNIVFHTDIARDFLVLHDIVETHKFTLIGPRAGGIPGVFHGPLWFYVNLPIFFISGGNPAATAWFWVGLCLLSMGIVYYVGRKLYDSDIGLIAVLLYSSFLIPISSLFTNSFGAVIVFPLFFYLMLRYTEMFRIRYLLGALFSLGIIVQFQVGFGAVMLPLTFVYVLFLTIRKKAYWHIGAFLILLIPLSTFLLFEVRHDFLQVKSALSYLTTKASSTSPGEIHLYQVPFFRIKSALLEGLGLSPQNSILTIPATILFLWVLVKTVRDKKLRYRKSYLLYFFLYFGFWIATFAYKGIVWGYFYFAFLPVTILVLVSFKAHVYKWIYTGVIAYFVLINMYVGIQNVTSPTLDWRLYVKRAYDVYQDADDHNFGYYVYSPDQYGYSTKYAMVYVGKKFPHSKEQFFKKDVRTYLLIAPPPDGKPWLNEKWWRENQVNINKNPSQTYTYPYGFKTEKYLLSNKEIRIPSDPNLIQDLTFR